MKEAEEQVRTKLPAEAVELYTRYIHGEVSRRDFLNGVKRFAIAGLSAEVIVQALMPNYALGQQVRKDDERIKATYETIPSPTGNGYIRGYFVRPFSRKPGLRNRPSCPPFSSFMRIAD
jgi:carboxymethylenebutenolidase